LARPKAFTLIELLVVVAIISLLVSILVPSLTHAKLMAMRAVCQVNFHGVGTNALMYVSESNGFIPISVTDSDVVDVNGVTQRVQVWRKMLYDYTGGEVGQFDCPGTRWPCKSVEDLNNQNIGSSGPIFQHAYALTGLGLHNPDYALGPYPARNAWIDPVWPVYNNWGWKDVANSMYIADAYICYGQPFTYPSTESWFGTAALHEITGPPPSLGETLWDARRFGDRHLGTNMLMLDGSVRACQTSELDAMIRGASDTIWDVF
jgi:prepilin-type N-terminal cleavage/methylation domain-containing protein/prepilin-type processing-associated H-X9-DG protein